MLADIEAFENGSELISFLGCGAEVRDDCLIISIDADYCAAFVAIGAKLIRLQNGHPDWARVQRLKLMEVSRCR